MHERGKGKEIGVAWSATLGPLVALKSAKTWQQAAILETIVAGACWPAERVHRNGSLLQHIISRQLSPVVGIAQIINPLDDLEAALGNSEVEQLVDGPWDLLMILLTFQKNGASGVAQQSKLLFMPFGLAQPTRL